MASYYSKVDEFRKKAFGSRGSSERDTYHGFFSTPTTNPVTEKKLVDAANRYIQTVANSAPSNQGFTSAILSAKRVNEGNALQKQLENARLNNASKIVGNVRDTIPPSAASIGRGGFTDAIYANERLKQLQQEAERQAIESASRSYNVNPKNQIEQANQQANRLKNDYRYKLAQSLFMTDRPSEQVLREFGSVENAVNYIERMDERIKAAEEQQKRVNYYGSNELKYGDLKNQKGYESAIRLSLNSTPTADKVLPKDAYANGITSENTDLYALFINGTEEQRNTIENGYGLGERVSFLRYLTDEQKNNYNYLRATQGAKAAEQYINDIEPTIKRQQFAADQAKAEAFAKADPVGASIQSALLSPIAGLDYITSLGDQAFGTGQDALGNARTFVWMPGQQKRTVRNTVTENLATPAGQFIYGTGMSMADNLVNRLASGGNSGIAMLLMGSGAASDAYYTAIENGRTEDEALTQATAAGIIEALTEKMGFENLTDIVKAGKTSFKSAATQVAKQAITEGLEEGTSNIANLAYDMLAYGEDSDAARRVNEYVKQGMTKEEAKRKVAGELAAEFGKDVAGGALSGGIFGAGGSIVGNIANIDSVYTTDKVTQRALLLDAKKNGFKQADAYNKKLNEGGTLTKQEFANAYDAIDVAQQKRETKNEKLRTYDKNRQTQTALTEEGKELGSEHAAEYAKILKNGGILTKQQYTTLVNENNAQIAKLEAQEQKGKTAQGTAENVGNAIRIGENNAFKAEVADTEEVVSVNKGVADIKGNVVYVETSKGIMPAKDLVLDKETDTLFAASDMFDPVTADVFVKNYNGSVSVAQYALDFARIYNAFKRGDEDTGFNYVAEAGSRLSNKILTAAVSAGTRASAENKTAGVILRTTNTGEDIKAHIDALDEFGKTVGRRIIIKDTIDATIKDKKSGKNITVKGGANAYFDEQTNEYYIALDSVDKAYLYIAAHESVHDIKKNNSQGFDNLKRIAFDVLKKNGADIESLIKTAQERENLSRERAEEEVLCNTVPAIFSKAETRQQFAEAMAGQDAQTKNAFVRFLEAIREFLTDTFNKLKKRGAWKQMQYVENDINGLKAITDAYAEALKGRDDATAASERKYSSTDINIVDLSDDNVLSNMVDGLYGTPRHNAICNYIFNELGGQQIEMSDGTIAIIDKSDAQHLSYRSSVKKTAQLSKLKEIIKQAKLYAIDENVEHNKFKSFKYYQTEVRYREDSFKIYVNVGKAKNDGKNHIYDLTKNLRNSANRLNDLGRVRDLRPGKQNFINNILQISEKSNRQFSLREYQEYLTEEAQKEYSEDSRFKNWVNKDIAFISAAAWDGVKIPADVLLSVPKIAEAQRKTQTDTTSMKQYPIGENAGRDALRRRLVGKLLDDQHGSAMYENGKLKKDATGSAVYTGEVLRERHAAIVIGRPAGGKSSVFADPLSNSLKARIIDADTVKPWLPEYDGGYGAGFVQDESSYIMEEALIAAAAKGENIVIPKIGGNSIIDMANNLKAAGYTVDLYFNEVSAESSIMRAASRFAETGRYLDIAYLNSIGDKPLNTFKKYAESGVFDYAEWRNNDVKFGEKPKLIWNSGSKETFRDKIGSDSSAAGRHGEGLQRVKQENTGGASQNRSEEIKKSIRRSAIDSEGNELSEQQAEALKGRETLKNNTIEDRRYSLKDIKLPSREELENKAPVEVIDISKPETAGRYAERRELILKKAEEIIKKPYLNRDTNVYIFLTEKSYTHAFSNKGELNINAAEHLPEFIESAILTHAEKNTHGNEYADGVYTFFAAAKSERIYPVKLKVKEIRYDGQRIPDNIKEFFENNPQRYAETYDTVVLEVEEIEESSNGSVGYTGYKAEQSDPSELSTITVAELLNLVKGDSMKYIPSPVRHEQESENRSYSLKDDQDIKLLIHENEVFQRRIYDQDKIIEELKRQMKPTDVLRNDRGEIEKYARYLKKTYSSSIDANYIADTLDEMYTEMMRAQPDEYYIRYLGITLARDILEKGSRNIVDEVHEETYKDIRKALKETTFSLTEQQKAEVKAVLGVSYGKFRQMMFNKLNMKNDAPSLDSYWAQFVEKSNGMLDIYTNEGDQIMALYDLANAAQKQYITAYQGIGLTLDEAAVDLFADMRAKQIELKVVQGTFADKMLKRIEAANARTEEIKQKERQKLQDYKEWRAKQTVLRGIKSKAKGLKTLLEKPKERSGQYVPDALKTGVLKVLNVLDFSTKNETKANKAWAESLQVLSNQLNYADDIFGDMALYLNPYLIPSFIAMTERVAKSSEGQNLEKMSVDDLKTIRDTLESIRHAIETANNLFKNERYSTATEAAEATMQYAQNRRHKFHDWKKFNDIKGFFNVGQMDAYTYFSMFGEAGQSIIDELSQGQDAAHDRIREAAEWTDGMRKELRLTHRDMAEWKKQKHTVKLESGESVTLTVREAMEFYVLSKREQAKGHILGGGFSLAADSIKRTFVSLSEKDIYAINNVLTDKQKNVADAMQKYLSTTVADWGNETSKKAYGVRLFNEPNYWRIRTVGSSLDAEDQANQIRNEAVKYARQNAAINAGFTKHTNKFANNPILVGDIFDSFDDHISGMATYNGLGLAIDDANKWLMYAKRDSKGKKIPNEDVKTAIRSVLGEVGVRYAENLLMDMNGLAPRVDESILSKLMSNYKKASVAAKIRVIIQQPTAVLRAMSEINPAFMTVSAIKQVKPGIVKEMQRYSSIAWWKSNGNYDIGTGKSIHEILFGSDKAMSKISNVAMLPAGKADDISWAIIWQACKEEYAQKNKVKIKSFTESDFDKVSARFSEIINKTQVVDTILHRSQNMRSKTVAMSQLTAFMSEPTKIFNMIRRGMVEFANADKPQKFKTARHLMRILLAWAASATANAAIKSLWDAFRKRDREKEYSEQYQETFISNVLDEVNPLKLIPVVNNLWSVAEGYDQTSMPFDFAEKLKNGVNQLTKFDDENRSFTMYSAAANLASFFSSAFGLPLSGLLSNFEGVWQAVTGENIKHKKSKTENFDSMSDALGAKNTRAYDKAYNDVYSQISQDIQNEKIEDPEEFAKKNKYLTDEEVIQKRITSGVKSAAKRKYYDALIDAFESGESDYKKMLISLEVYGIDGSDAGKWVKEEYAEEYITGRDKNLSKKLEYAGFDEDDLLSWVTDSYKEEVVRKMSKGDKGALKEYVKKLEKEEVLPQNIWTRCSSIFRDDYLEAWKNGDKERAYKIEEQLKSLGLRNKKGKSYANSDFFERWREAAKEDDE